MMGGDVVYAGQGEDSVFTLQLPGAVKAREDASAAEGMLARA